MAGHSQLYPKMGRLDLIVPSIFLEIGRVHLPRSAEESAERLIEGFITLLVLAM